MNRLRKPRGSIPLSTIGYYGVPAYEGRLLRYSVIGNGHFPDDMLRYDGAKVLSPVETEGRERREVRIVHAARCTPERWRSFGWVVKDDVDEYAPPGV